MASPPSKKEQLYRLIQVHPTIAQQELADALQLSRSAVAGHIASLMRERRILGRAYVLPEPRAVLCIGGANIDRKLRTVAPLQMGTSNPVSQHETPGGVARNIAENLARLGAAAGLLCAVGNDAAGQFLLQHSAAAGVDTRSSLQLDGATSGSYTAVLDQNGELQLALAHMDCCEALTPDCLRRRAAERRAAALVVADLNLPADSLALLLRETAPLPLVFVAVSQPKMARLPQDLRGLSLLILNCAELETRVARSLPDAAAWAAACREVQRQGARDVVLTLGAQGAMFTTADGCRSLPAEIVPLVDVTGAGDAFAAAVCQSLLQTPDDLELACRRGLQLAAHTVQSGASVCVTLPPGFM